MRTMSIPRLELQTAVLGTRLMNTVKEEHSVVINDVVLWSDSKTVLRWIGSTHRRYKQSVGNRVSEILDSSKVSHWRWVPTAENAANPSEGGIWERMVQCVKRVLRHTLKEVAPREHVLESFLIEAENVVNSRPLTHLPVTPNDLLKGVANLPDTPGQGAELPKECSTRKHWRIARLLRDRPWKRWVLEYLPTLVRHEKWCRWTEPIRQGDMVFICDPALPRREWRKGIVEGVYNGADGVARRATVRKNDNGLSRTMMRPVSKLLKFELSEAVLHGVGDVDDRIL
ncbi:hypothetical protein KR200_001004 [Drosophila serrata]|nr:hypothetical protein KR200_001004 [Drosophila serrata]